MIRHRCCPWVSPSVLFSMTPSSRNPVFPEKRLPSPPFPIKAIPPSISMLYLPSLKAKPKLSKLKAKGPIFADATGPFPEEVSAKFPDFT